MKFAKLLEKARSMVVSRVNQRMISIPQIQYYPDLQDVSTSHHLVSGQWGQLLGERTGISNN